MLPSESFPCVSARWPRILRFTTQFFKSFHLEPVSVPTRSRRRSPLLINPEITRSAPLTFLIPSLPDVSFTPAVAVFPCFVYCSSAIHTNTLPLALAPLFVPPPCPSPRVNGQPISRTPPPIVLTLYSLFRAQPHRSRGYDTLARILSMPNTATRRRDGDLPF